MGVLSREQILAVRDHRVIEVEVPEWGGSVFVRTMAVVDQEAYMTDVAKRGSTDITGLQVTLACLTMCDADGKRLFTSAEDVEALGTKSWVALGRVCDAAQTLNLMNGDALKARKGE